MKISPLIISTLFASYLSAEVDLGYIVGATDNNVYILNLETGQTQLLTPAPIVGATINGIGSPDNITGYLTGFADGTVYSVDFSDGSFSALQMFPGENLQGIGILGDSTTGYITTTVGFDSNVYAVDLGTGNPTLVTNFVNASLTGIAIASPTLAYTLDSTSGSLYALDIPTGNLTQVATLGISSPLNGISLEANEKAYITDSSGTIYSVNLPAGGTFDVLTTSIPTPTGISLRSRTEAFVSNFTDDNIYLLDLTTGTASIFTVNPITGAGVYGINLGNVGTFDIPITCLAGSALTLANYFNSYAPTSIIDLFGSLSCDSLNLALLSASPARNAYSTFTSQIGVLSASTALEVHLSQKRFHRNSPSSKMIASNEIAFNEIAESTCNNNSVKMDEMSCNHPYTAWINFYGDYSRLKKQQYTPEFTAGSGGLVTGFDFNSHGGNIFGIGAAYNFSHIKQSEHAGSANVNQGLISLYKVFNDDNWYLDLAAWGGYYNSQNRRNISFPGFNATAKASIHGWQVAPHLEAGYNIGKSYSSSGFGVTPFLLADWVVNWENGYNEEGASPLNMGQKSRFCTFLRTEAGFKFHNVANFDCGRLVFQERLSYAYQKAFHTGNIHAFLVGSPSSFIVTTLNGAQNLGVAEVSFTFIRNGDQAPYFGLSYLGEFGSKYLNQQAMFEIGKDF